MSHSRSDNNDAARHSSSDKPSLRQRMSQDLQLRGMAKRTHDGYLREVRKLAAYYDTPLINSPNNKSASICCT